MRFLLVVLACIPLLAASACQRRATEPSADHLASGLSRTTLATRLPVLFEENLGQADEGARLVVRRPTHGALLGVGEGAFMGMTGSPWQWF